MMFKLLQSFFASLLITHAYCHSQLTRPHPFTQRTCRLGGDPQFGVDDCEGPCDIRALEGGYATFDSPDNPGAVLHRGQIYTIKYQRNNHAPGGFIRLTMVPPDKMMNKAEHEKNAFYYSCWGANSVKAKTEELGREPNGFSMIGSDAEQHDLEPGYYTSDVKIPAVIPDGDYVLGWAWFGGIGGGEVENNGSATNEPAPWGYFSDYWTCSFVRVEGGDDLIAEYTPVFDNDMEQFSSEGCMAANDALGICSFEPCEVTGKYQKPRDFKDGKTPQPLTPRDFGGKSPTVPVRSTPTETPTAPMPPEENSTEPSSEDMLLVAKRSCRCIAAGDKCWNRLSRRTLGYCSSFTNPYDQPTLCKKWCCGFCENRRKYRLCTNENVKGVCSM